MTRNMSRKRTAAVETDRSSLNSSEMGSRWRTRVAAPRRRHATARVAPNHTRQRRRSGAGVIGRECGEVEGHYENTDT